MATLKQIAANRRNAQKSTGPRTEAGKAVSRFNALKSGIHAESDITPCEEPADLKRLTAEYFDRFQPTTPEARFLVDTLITNDWLLRRLRNAEAAVWEHAIDDTFSQHDHAVAMAVENQVRCLRTSPAPHERRPAPLPPRPGRSAAPAN